MQAPNLEQAVWRHRTKVHERNLARMNSATIDKVIGMAWADRVSFEEIEKSTGLTEAEVIKLMRRELKPGSFRLWRKRVSGRKTKHRKIWKHERRGDDSLSETD